MSALHLRPQLRLRRSLRVQRAEARLNPDQAPSGVSPAPDGLLKDRTMHSPIFFRGTLLLALASAATFQPPAVAGVPPSAEATASPTLSVPPAKAGRARPLIVVVADKGGAQTTDFIVPYGVLKASGVADVRSLSTRGGPIEMTRGLRIVADETIAQFDAREESGADIVIVPAQAKPSSPALLKWVRDQAAKGATIIAVCEGARVLASAGLLDGKRAVTHWASLNDMAKSHPTTMWVRDRRYVQDGSIITTAGVTASIPMSLALVEAIGGRPAAEDTARRFGAKHWGPSHKTAGFEITKADRTAAAQAARAKRETTEIPIDDNVDEVSLALQAEAWGRSMRTTVKTTRPGRSPVRSRNGLVILPDAESKAGSHVVPAATLPAVPALAETLAQMGSRYGPSAPRFAVLAMEYDGQEAE